MYAYPLFVKDKPATTEKSGEDEILPPSAPSKLRSKYLQISSSFFTILPMALNHKAWQLIKIKRYLKSTLRFRSRNDNHQTFKYYFLAIVVIIQHFRHFYV
ncbi:MAG: hypothetical protein C0608_02040 [Deltaproteobacteria bacterium]|nr:MAG: hypothetical protein C0608_02040 [Deltaproteobacteria bacterium]